MEPMQTHGGTAQEGRTHGKRGTTQEKVRLGIVRGRGYKIERSPLILDHSVMCIFELVVSTSEHAGRLASLQHCLVH